MKGDCKKIMSKLEKKFKNLNLIYPA